MRQEYITCVNKNLLAIFEVGTGKIESISIKSFQLDVLCYLNKVNPVNQSY